MKDFGILLKTLRKEAALTQKELADKLGIDSSNISKWECNKNLPDVSIFPQIANVLDVTCDELLHPTETLEKMNELSDENIPPACDNTISVPDNDHESKLASESTVITQKRKLFTPKRILLACIPIIVLVISICAYGYSQTNFRFIEARTNVMTEHGPAYELVYCQKQNLDGDTFMAHASSIHEQWKEGAYSDSSEEVLLVTYYPSNATIDNLDALAFRAVFFLNSQQP